MQLAQEDLYGIIDELSQLLEDETKEIQYLDWIPNFTLQAPFILYEEKEKVLGISSAVLKSVYKLVYQECMNFISWDKSNLNKNNCLAEVESKTVSSSPRWEINSLSKITLLIKGDLSFIYNLRKKLLIENPRLIPYEIPFTSLVFSKHPKSPSGWEHRRFCYKLKYQHQTIKLLHMELVTEQELCRRSADAYPKNYYAWMHRLWLLQFYTISQLEDELDFIKNWIFQHPSDHSAVNHYIQVAHRILQHPNNHRLPVESTHTLQQPLKPLVYISNILNEIEENFRRYVIRETLWQWRRLLFHLLTEHLTVEVFTISLSEEAELLSCLQWHHSLIQDENSVDTPTVHLNDNTLSSFLYKEVFFLGSIYQTNREDRDSIIKFGQRYLSYIFHILLRQTRGQCLSLQAWYNLHLLPHFLSPTKGT